MEQKLTPREFELLVVERQELIEIESKLMALKDLYDSKKASFSRLALMVFDKYNLDPSKHLLDFKNQQITTLPATEAAPENVSGVDISEDIGDEL